MKVTNDEIQCMKYFTFSDVEQCIAKPLTRPSSSNKSTWKKFTSDSSSSQSFFDTSSVIHKGWGLYSNLMRAAEKARTEEDYKELISQIDQIEATPDWQDFLKEQEAEEGCFSGACFLFDLRETKMLAFERLNQYEMAYQILGQAFQDRRKAFLEDPVFDAFEGFMYGDGEANEMGFRKSELYQFDTDEKRYKIAYLLHLGREEEAVALLREFPSPYIWPQDILLYRLMEKKLNQSIIQFKEATRDSDESQFIAGHYEQIANNLDAGFFCRAASLAMLDRYDEALKCLENQNFSPLYMSYYRALIEGLRGDMTHLEKCRQMILEKQSLKEEDCYILVSQLRLTPILQWLLN